MAYGYEGTRMRLTQVEERHFDNIYRWINDPEVNQWLGIGDFPLGDTNVREWLDRHRKDSESDVAFAIELLDGTHIGTCGIHGIDLRHGYAITGSYIGEPGLRGMGYGKEMSKLRAWYCFHILGLRMIMSGYIEGNEASRKMNESAGYVQYGVAPKKFWKNGAYRDDYLTVLTRERWLELSGGAKDW